MNKKYAASILKELIKDYGDSVLFNKEKEALETAIRCLKGQTSKAKTGGAAKSKGARFERELSSKLKEYGYDCRRTAQYCGKTGNAADVVGLPKIHIEAKSVEHLNIFDAMAQAKRDSQGSKDLPAVFHKRNNTEILVTMQLETWIKLYKEYELSLKSEE